LIHTSSLLDSKESEGNETKRKLSSVTSEFAQCQIERDQLRSDLKAQVDQSNEATASLANSLREKEEAIQVLNSQLASLSGIYLGLVFGLLDLIY
jgi:hypothetical protein